MSIPEKIRAAIAEVWEERTGVVASTEEHIEAMVDRVVKAIEEEV